MNGSVKKIVMIVAAVAVVAGAAAAVVGLLGGVSPRQAGGVAGVMTGPGRRVDVDQVKTLSLAGVKRIEVEVVNSDVTVSESADGSASAHLSGTVSASGSSLVPELVAEMRGDTAVFRVDHRNVTVVMGWYRSDLRLEVAIPKSYQGALAIRSVSASIQVPAGRTYTTLDVGSVSGGIDLGAFTADEFRAHSVSGDLGGNASAKSANLNTTSGSIVFGGFTGDLSAHSVSGTVNITWDSFSGRADVGTTSGDVSLGIPTGSGFRLEAGSTSGRITTDHPVTVQGSTSGPGRRRLEGDVGSGTGSVKVRTVSGSIAIGK